MNSFSSYSQEKSDFRAHFDFTAINIKVRISVVPLQCPCLHIRGGFFLLLPSGFLAENICWILGPKSPIPLGYQHSCYMYIFVLGSLAMRGTLTLIKFPAAEDEGKCHDRKVAEMKLSFRPNWQEGRPQLAGGQRKLVWHCIALHCIAISYLRKSQVKLTRVAKFGLKNDFLRMAALTQSKRFFDYYLRAWRFIGTCQREKIQFDVEDFSSLRHASVLQCSMWQRQRCMWSVLAAHFLAVHLALHFVSMSFFCENQYTPNSIWELLYGCQQKIMSEFGNFVLYHPIWKAFEIAFLNAECFLIVHTTEFVT